LTEINNMSKKKFPYRFHQLHRFRANETESFPFQRFFTKAYYLPACNTDARVLFYSSGSADNDQKTMRQGIFVSVDA